MPTLEIIYESGDPAITLSEIYPRDEAWSVKDFTVTGTNTIELSHAI